MKWRDGSAVVATPTLDMPALAHAIEERTAFVPPSFDEVYAAHFGFVWRVLRTFGVPAASLEDAAQDVFVVVHRRLPEFEGRAAITTWLFAIVLGVARNHRRSQRRRAPEAPGGEEPDALVGAAAEDGRARGEYPIAQD